MGQEPAKSTAHRAGNDTILKELDLPRPQSMMRCPASAPGSERYKCGFCNLRIHSQEKWPLVFLIPWRAARRWEDSWSNRWNHGSDGRQITQITSSILPNPRGSTGFGQQFVDEISRDWGGRCYEDLMACLAYLEKQPYIDKERMASGGASFGGLHDELVPGPYWTNSRP